MVMKFSPGWQNAKITPIPSDTELTRLRTGKSKSQQKREGISEKCISYQTANNKKREDGKVFLSFFSETDMRNAIQYAHDAFNHDAGVRALLADAIGTVSTVTIDQGTHQEEDRTGGGFKLHFDARRSSDDLCFHMYVGQNTWGGLRIVEVSYNGSAGFKDVTPTRI